MFKVLGVALVVFAIAIAVVPMFTDCQSQGKAITLANGKTVPMKCHWSGVGEQVAAVPLIAVGAMMPFMRRRETLTGLSVMGVVLGAFVISLPVNLIGTCTSGMLCETVMKPTLVTLGGLVVAGGVLGLVLSRRQKDF